MSGARLLLVGNPTAQSGKNVERIEQARKWLGDAGIPCDFLATLPEGKTIAAVRDAIDAHPFETIIYMGGDGTFREVASGILGSKRRDDVRMGMLPTGTANDQGRSFGLEAGDGALVKNLEVIRAGNETKLDAGRITAGGCDALFFDSAGWGISARVLAERNMDRELVKDIPIVREVYRDQLVYAGALLRVFLESYVVDDKFDVTIEHDGKRTELTGMTDLIVKNTRIYGGAWVFDKTCKHDDGLLEVIPFLGKRDWTSKAIVDLDGNLLSEEVLNQVGIEHSKSFRIATMEMTIAERQARVHAQIDGEEFPSANKVRIETLRRALRLIVPYAGGVDNRAQS